MVALGAASYALSVYSAAIGLRGMVRAGDIRQSDVPRLTYLPYWVGGALLVAGALPNPVSPWLILSAGASSGFGAMAGLLWVPRLAAAPREERDESARPLAFSPGWTVAATVVVVLFVLVIGRGISL